MSDTSIVSIIPYKVLPARLGGEKGIAVFNEYIGKLIPLTGVTTKNSEASEANNYRVLTVLSNSRLRYINVFLYFRLRSIIKKQHATHLLIEHPYYGWLAYLLRVTLPITWVVHSHNIEFERSQSIGRWWWKALKWYECWVYRNSDINFFISEDDRQYAIGKLNIDPRKSHTITYGVEIPAIPSDRDICRQKIQELHGVTADEKILLFNGALYHHTNYNALQVILDYINPKLLSSGLPYKIIICGKGLPAHFDELRAYSGNNIIYAGFVEDISTYFKAADIFLNPILSGGGVKTKAIEAIAYNCAVVSTKLGALGIVQEVCGDQLKIVSDSDWSEFGIAVVNLMRSAPTNTTTAFYLYYYWGNIAAKVKDVLSGGFRFQKK